MDIFRKLLHGKTRLKQSVFLLSLLSILLILNCLPYPALHRSFLQHRHQRHYPVLKRPLSCSGGKPLFLLIAIKSLAENADRRAAIRSTWGREGTVGGMQVKRVFLLAESERQIRNQVAGGILEEESSEHGDILQWGFRESFFNVTLKEYLFWRWFGEDCASVVQYIWKGDDDVFVNIDNVIRYLKGNSNPKLYMGKAFVNWYPVRIWWNKYYIPMSMYSGKSYPPYIGGGGYLLSRESILLLSKASARVHLFPIDDVYVGMCAQAANISVQDHPGFITYEDLPFEPCEYRKLMVVHKVQPNELYLMWSLVKHQGQSCPG